MNQDENHLTKYFQDYFKQKDERKKNNIFLLGVNKFSLFLCKNCGFIVKKLYNVFYSKYCPSLVTTFSHLSGSISIPCRKKSASFEAIH